MTVLLAIETTGTHLGLSLFQVDREKKTGSRLGTYYSKDRHRQSDKLFPALEQLLGQNRLKKTAINFIAVDIGPGSFTGVRVGVSAARALAQSWNVSLLGISSLEAMAHRGFKRRNRFGHCLVPMQKALEGEVYAAAYLLREESLQEIIKPCWMKEKEFSDVLTRKKNSRRSLNYLKITDPPHPDSVAELAVQKILGKEKPARFDYNRVQPLYLQPSWAERKS